MRELLGERSTGKWLDERTTYDYLYEAAKQWVIETECLTTTQSITTTGETQEYTINGDYLGLYLQHNGKYYLKYNDGTDDYFINFKPYSDVIYDNQTTSQSVPGYFTIHDDPTLDDLISDTADNDGGSAVGGKATLTMDTAVFADVTPGDIIHNTTDGSDGVVVGKVSSGSTANKVLYVALFGGTDNEIDASDAFIIQPRKRFQLLFEPPPSTDSHTATLYYLQKPDPVYTDYDVYKVAYEYPLVLAKYAAWLYKYRDKEPNFGDAWYQYWDMKIKEYRRLTNKGWARTSRLIPKWHR